MWEYQQTNELLHYGVKGMKWGVRKYQNENGTLTQEGKKRYFNTDGTLNKKGSKESNKFARAANGRWYKSYNKATDEFNSKIGAINNKHSKVKAFNDDGSFNNTKESRKYINDIGKLWTDAYSKQLLKDFGANPLYSEDGKQWVETMPFFNTYKIENYI